MTLITPFITTPYISRVLGADGTGVQSYTNSVVQYFAILAALGTASYGQREIARHRDDIKMRNRLFWEIEALCMPYDLAGCDWFCQRISSLLYRAYHDADCCCL